MSTRLSGRAALAVGLSIVAMMMIWAPVMALADSGSSAAPTTPPGNSAAAPGQSDAVPPGQSSDAAPGNSESAPGQADAGTTAATTTATAPGNSGGAPGQNKPDTTTTTTTTTTATPPGNSGNSNAGGNSNTGGGAGGGSSSSNGGGSKSTTGSVPGDNKGDPAHEGDCDQTPGRTGGAYDETCDGTHQNPGPGNSDNSPGKPADGTVGKADNKNPKGQQPGGSDHNKGYECEPGETNKGVGKGNPAHTGCAPTPPPCANSAGVSQWTLSVSVTHGSASHTSTTYSSLPANFTITATAATGYSTTGAAGGSTTSSYTTVFSSTDCAESFTVVFSPNGSNPCPPGTDHAGEFVSPCDDTETPCPPGTDHAGEFVSPCDDTGNPPPPPDCDNDGIDDNVDSDISSCQPLPPKTDCDRDGIPDDVDADTASCDPDEVLGIKLCPDGSIMPPNGKCDEPELEPDQVLGIRLNQPAAVAPAVVNKPAVAASLLPFTGGNIFPFVLVSLSLIGAGLPALRRRKK